jgi:L-2-hydroxycarboxylate dehydrogenase (NAD+)
MKVAIAEIVEKMKSALKAKGYAAEDLDFIVNMYLGGELRGHKSHGLASFAGFVNHDFSDLEPPEVLKETHSLFMIDAKGNSGNVVGRRAADEAIKRAEQEAVGVAMIKNMETWLRPGAVAEYVANKGFVAVVINSGGEAAVAPPGGFDPVTGTNPIAYGIPTDDGPLVVDMATSKRAKGQIRLANKYGTDLPAYTFYDAAGNVTLDPKEAFSVMPFGDYKGFSLALLVEVLCGSLVGAPMMVQVGGTNHEFGGFTPTRQALILVINPRQTTDAEEFQRANSEFIQKIKATRTRKGEKIRIPGEQAAREHAAKLKAGTIDLPEELWNEIKSL